MNSVIKVGLDVIHDLKAIIWVVGEEFGIDYDFPCNLYCGAIFVNKVFHG